MKTLHSVIARWTSKHEHKSGKSAESESNESKVEEDEGYCLDKGTNLLSRTWSREEMEKQTRNKKDRYDNRRCNSNERKNNVNSSNSEDSEDKVSGGGSRERLDKRQQGWKGNKSDSPGIGMRGSKRGESGNPGTKTMRVRNKEYK
jgi:hypothetical protein